MKPLTKSKYTGLILGLLQENNASSLRERFARGAFFSVAGAFCAQALTIAAMMVTARIIGRHTFGELGIIQSTTAMFAAFSNAGMGLTATKYVAELRGSDPERAGRIIALCSASAAAIGAVCAVALFILADVIAVSALNSPQLAGSIRVASIALAFNTVRFAETGALAGFEAYRTIAWVSLLSGLAGFPIAVAGAFFGLRGAVWAVAITAGVTAVAYHIALRRHCRRNAIPIRFRELMKERDVLLNFSLPAAMNAVVIMVVSWGGDAMLVNRPRGYDEMGILNAVRQWRSALIFLPSLLGQVVVPIISSSWSHGEVARVRKALLAAIGASAICSGLPALFIVVLSGRILSTYGAGFRGREAVLLLTCVAAFVIAVQTPLGQMIAATGRMWLGFYMSAGWAIIYLSLAAATLSRGLGADGIAVAYLLSYVCLAASSYWVANRFLRQLAASRQPGIAGAHSGA